MTAHFLFSVTDGKVDVVLQYFLSTFTSMAEEMAFFYFTSKTAECFFSFHLQDCEMLFFKLSPPRLLFFNFDLQDCSGCLFFDDVVNISRVFSGSP